MSINNNQLLVNDLRLKFGINTNEIDSNTLINSIIHFSNIVQEVNKELQTNRKIEVKIKAFEPGSFIVNIAIESNIIEAVGSLFTAENLKIAASLVSVVGGLYKAAKFLKGEKPKTIEATNNGIKIENTQGNVTVIDQRVYNIYKAPVVQEIIAKEFETLENDPEVQSFDITDGNDHSIVEFERNEFSDIANLDSTEHEDTRTISKTTILHIITLSFEKKKKWEFFFDGNKIQAKIDDEVFHQHIDGGESFAKGDTLKARLEILQKFNTLANTYGNSSYKVTEIYEHSKKPQQDKLF